MFTIINKIINLIYIKSFTIIKADLSDIDYVLSEIINSAKDGHYTEALLDFSMQYNYRKMLECYITRQSVQTLTDTGVEFKYGQLYVYGNRKVGTIGYFVISEKNEGSINYDVELLMFGINKLHQSKGHGKNLLKKLLLLKSESQNIYARCYKKSYIMLKLLLEAGFDTIMTKPSGSKELIYKGNNNC